MAAQPSPLPVCADGVMKDTLDAQTRARTLAGSALVNLLVAGTLCTLAVDNAQLIADSCARLMGSADFAAGFEPFTLVAVVSLITLLVALLALLEHATLFLELRETLRAEARAWNCGGKSFYEGAQWVALRRGRHVAVVTRNIPCFSQTTPCFFFVHGSMARLGQFGAIIKRVEKLGCGCFSFDMFGMGRSAGRYMPIDDGSDAYSTSSFSRDELLLDLIAAYACCCEQSGGPVIIVAHSFGCQLAIELALNIADPLCLDMPKARDPAGMVLLGCQGPVDGGDADLAKYAKAKRLFGLPLFVLRLIRPFLSRGFKERAFHTDTVAVLEGINSELNSGTCTPTPERSRYLRNMLEYAAALSGSNSMAVCKAFYTQTLGTGISTARLKRHRGMLPFVHLVTGASDQIASPKSLAPIIEALGAEYTEIPLAGHQCMEEQPDAVFDVLCEMAFKVSGKKIVSK